MQEGVSLPGGSSSATPPSRGVGSRDPEPPAGKFRGRPPDTERFVRAWGRLSARSLKGT